MRLYAKSNSPREPRLSLELGADDLVSGVKAQIGATRGLDPQRIRLVLNGEAVPDSTPCRSLAEHAVLFYFVEAPKPKPSTSIKPASSSSSASAPSTLTAPPPPPPGTAAPLFNADMVGDMLQQLIRQQPPGAQPMAVDAPAPTPTPTPTLPEPPAVELQQLVDMGFPAARARKALLLCRMSLLGAIEWLSDHAGEPGVDDPLTLAQIAAVTAKPAAPHRGGHAHYGSGGAGGGGGAAAAPRVSPLQDALARNVCTFSVTGETYAPQQFFQCFTCGLIENEGCCKSCAVTCHAGHSLSDARFSSRFYCDCACKGSGGPK